jgi:hypothetical protein
MSTSSRNEAVPPAPPPRHRTEWHHLIYGVSHALMIQRVFQKSFTNLEADINLFRGHVQCFEVS